MMVLTRMGELWLHEVGQEADLGKMGGLGRVRYHEEIQVNRRTSRYVALNWSEERCRKSSLRRILPTRRGGVDQG